MYCRNTVDTMGLKICTDFLATSTYNTVMDEFVMIWIHIYRHSNTYKLFEGIASSVYRIRRNKRPPPPPLSNFLD